MLPSFTTNLESSHFFAARYDPRRQLDIALKPSSFLGHTILWLFPARTAVTFVIKCWLAANVTVAQGPIGWSHSEVDRPCASFRSRTEGSYRSRLDQYAHLETFWAFIYEIEQGSELLHAFKIVIKMHEHFGIIRDVATLNSEYS